MEENVVEFKNVSFSYGGHPVIENATFLVKKGDYLGMIGPNGAGKTTLLRLMLGLLEPDFGQVFLFGQSVKHFRDWRKIGYVPQKATSFDPSFPASVFEVASMGRIPLAKQIGKFSEEDILAVEKALEIAGISHLKNERIGDLSAGQQQRAFMARALASEPQLLILDEPMVGLDQKAQHEFYSILKMLNQEKKVTLIFVSHDIGVIARNVGKIACVNTKVTIHKTSKIDEELLCYYGKDMEFIPHHHH